ncbi:MAG: glycosyltransferase family 2 protein [Alistipes sp.]|nr:glycosyltransferase family 2 protein [Alistipes sp.]
MREFKFSIFTPLYNGEKTIHRVVESLGNSVYRNFEWIVVNDGSTDDSIQVLNGLIKGKDWDITIIDSKENRGKHIAWNEAAKIAKGEIFINLDCDDAFVPESLSFLNEKWNEHFADDKISGIDVLCVDADTEVVCGSEYPYDGIVSNYEDFYSIHKVRGDKWNTFRTEYVKMYPFPTVKANYYTECYLLYLLAEQFYTVGYNEKLRKYYYEKDSITHTKTEKINTVYMIMHYQKWHIPRVALRLLKKNPRELCRCIKELVLMTLKYSVMKMFKIAEIKYNE